MEIPGYQIIGTVGQGGMALVYEAIQKSLHRKVALKVLSPALVADPEFCQRFLDEGKTIARLSHPHIVTIYDIGHHEDQYFMSMEFVEGGNLRSRIEAGMDEREVVSVARQVARALGYAHDHGFLHRDVKPHNVLFRGDGDAVLSDFGIAKNLSENSELTRTGKSLGSPLYMSPEQIRGEPLDARSDLYSLGVVIYQMLTGYAPYLATTPDSTTRMHLSCPLPRLPEAQEKFQPIIRRLLAKSRNNRFLNAWELIEALDAIPLGEAAEPAAPGRPEDTQTIVVEPPVAEPPEFSVATGPEATQELEPEQRRDAFEKLDAARIVASRDDDAGGLAATRENTPTVAMERPEKPGRGWRRLALGAGLLTLLIGALVAFYPDWSGHWRTNSGQPVTVAADGAAAEGTVPPQIEVSIGDQTVTPAAPPASEPSRDEAPHDGDESAATLAELDAPEALDSAPEPVGAPPREARPDAQKPAAQVEIEPARPLALATREPETVSPAEVGATTRATLAAEAEGASETSVKPSREAHEAAPEDEAARAETDGVKPVPFSSLKDPGLVKVDGDYWISHELENILRRDAPRVLRLGDGSLLISLSQAELFEPDSDRFLPGATDKLDRLAYVFRNYSGFDVVVGASRSEFNMGEVLDLNVLRSRRVMQYLTAQMNNPARLKPAPVKDTSSIDGGSIDFHLQPIPVI